MTTKIYTADQIKRLVRGIADKLDSDAHWEDQQIISQTMYAVSKVFRNFDLKDLDEE